MKSKLTPGQKVAIKFSHIPVLVLDAYPEGFMGAELYPGRSANRIFFYDYNRINVPTASPGVIYLDQEGNEFIGSAKGELVWLKGSRNQATDPIEFDPDCYKVKP